MVQRNIAIYKGIVTILLPLVPAFPSMNLYAVLILLFNIFFSPLLCCSEPVINYKCAYVNILEI